MAMSGLPLLDWTEAAVALEQRLAQLEFGLAELTTDQQAARPIPDHVEAMFEFTRSRLNAERDWLRAFLSKRGAKTLEGA